MPGLQGLGGASAERMAAGRGCCACLPRAGKTALPSFPCETAAPILGPLAAELVAAKVAWRHEFCSLKDAKWHFVEDEGKALTRRGSWAPRAAGQAACGDIAVLSRHQLLLWHLAAPAPVQQLRCRHEHRGVAVPLMI